MLTRCKMGMVVVTNRAFIFQEGRKTLLGKLAKHWTDSFPERIDGIWFDWRTVAQRRSKLPGELLYRELDRDSQRQTAKPEKRFDVSKIVQKVRPFLFLSIGRLYLSFQPPVRPLPPDLPSHELFPQLSLHPRTRIQASSDSWRSLQLEAPLRSLRNYAPAMNDGTARPSNLRISTVVSPRSSSIDDHRSFPPLPTSPSSYTNNASETRPKIHSSRDTSKPTKAKVIWLDISKRS